MYICIYIYTQFFPSKPVVGVLCRFSEGPGSRNIFSRYGGNHHLLGGDSHVLKGFSNNFPHLHLSYPLVLTNIAMENGHRNRGFSHEPL